MCDNLRVSQVTSQQVFKPTTVCLDSLFRLDQLHHPPRCAGIQPMSQKAAAATPRPCCVLVLDTHVPASCPVCGNLPDLDQGCLLAAR